MLKHKHIEFLENVSRSTAMRRIKEVHDLLPKERPGRHAKITLAEYAEHYQFPITDLVTQLNTKFTLEIVC